MGVEQMEQIINYRDIPTNKRIDILNALEPVSYTHLDVYKRQVLPRAHHEDVSLFDLRDRNLLFHTVTHDGGCLR